MTIIEGHISIPVRFILLPMAVHPRLVASECSHEEIQHDLVVIIVQILKCNEMSDIKH